MQHNFLLSTKPSLEREPAFLNTITPLSNVFAYILKFHFEPTNTNSILKYSLITTFLFSCQSCPVFQFTSCHVPKFLRDFSSPLCLIKCNISVFEKEITSSKNNIRIKYDCAHTHFYLPIHVIPLELRSR